MLDLDDGLLPDPLDPYSSYRNQSLVELADVADRRVRVLLGEPGMGKTTELHVEIDRLRAEGSYVAFVDLGIWKTRRDIEDDLAGEIAGVPDDGPLVVALDSFDEALLDIDNLAYVLPKVLGKLDKDRLRLLICCRVAQWPPRLAETFREWWGSTEITTLQLAPLRGADIAEAAIAETGVDPDLFLSAVRDAQAQPLAARPVTLRLMLSTFRDSGVARDRKSIYERGVAHLARELNERRVEAGRDGSLLENRLQAARRLATVTLLSGTSNVVRRVEDLDMTQHAVIGLDTITKGEVTFEHLEDVWHSGLLTGAETRRWIHRSIEEYLCAQRLSELPWESSENLLTVAGDGRIDPALEETAAWLAGDSPEMFEHLLVYSPQLLLNPDLRSRSQADKRRVGQAVLRAVAAGPVLNSRAFSLLDYEGLADDVRPLLDPQQEMWLRGRAIRIATATHLRALDDELLEIVEDAVDMAAVGTDGARAPGQSEREDLAHLAIVALAGTSDRDSLEKLKALLTRDTLSDRLRASLVRSLFPTVISLDELCDLVAPEHRGDAIGRHVSEQMAERTARQEIPLEDALRWYSEQDGVSTWSIARQSEKDGAVAVLERALTTAEVGGTAWRRAVLLAVRLFRQLPHRPFGSATQRLDVAEERRRQFAADMMEGKHDSFLARDLILRGFIQTTDLDWWLDRLIAGSTLSPHGDIAARAVVGVLAVEVADDTDALAAARSKLDGIASLATLRVDLFGEAAVAAMLQKRAEDDAERAERAARQEELQFSRDRLHVLLDDGFVGAIDELDRRHTGPREGPRGPFQSWAHLSEDDRSLVAHAALAFLQDQPLGEHEPEYFATQSPLALALETVEAYSPSWLDQIQYVSWFRWLDAALDNAQDFAAQLFCVRRAAKIDAGRCTSVLVAHLDSRPSRPVLQARLLDEDLPKDLIDAVADRALELAADPSVGAVSLGGLLDIAAISRPVATADIAIEQLVQAAIALAPDDGRTDPTPDGPSSAVGTRNALSKAGKALRHLLTNPSLAAVFDRLIVELENRPSIALGEVGNMDPSRIRQAFEGLTADQLARFYLWAKETFPKPDVPAGTVYTAPAGSTLSDDALAVLIDQNTREASQALGHLSDQTGNVNLRDIAVEVDHTSRAAEARPPSPRAILEILEDPDKRVIADRAQLARVVLAELEGLATALRQRRSLLKRVWERQRDGTVFSDEYVPVEETDLSDFVKDELDQRLPKRIVSSREVQIQPRLGAVGADVPDLLISVAAPDGTGRIDLPIEVKGNYNRDVIGSLTTQLVDRYLTGPVGSEGIYLVGYFDGDAWRTSDRNRRSLARRYSIPELREALRARAETALSRGIKAHVRVIDLSLDRDPTDAVTPS